MKPRICPWVVVVYVQYHRVLLSIPPYAMLLLCLLSPAIKGMDKTLDQLSQGRMPIKVSILL